MVFSTADERHRARYEGKRCRRIEDGREAGEEQATEEVSNLDCLAASFRKEYMKVRRDRLGVKLAHHQRDLTPMVGGVVRRMLHRLRQRNLRRAKRNHCLQRLFGHAVHEVNLLFLDFRQL